MKSRIYLILFLLAGQSCATSSTVFELDGQQSMCLTGKGAGQDAATNPYAEGRSIAIVKNLSANPIEVRIQYAGNIIEIIEVTKNSQQEVTLDKGYELYLDSDLVAKARVKFKKY